MPQEFEWIDHGKFSCLKIFLVHLVSRNPHWHGDLELDLALEGSVRVQCPGVEYILSPGDVILLGGNRPHGLEQVGKVPNTVLSLQVSPRFCRDYFPELERMEFGTELPGEILSPGELEKLRSLMTAAAASFLGKEPCRAFSCMADVNSLFALLTASLPFRLVSRQEQAGRTSRLQKLSRIVDRIEEGYSQPLYLSRIAREEGFSLSYLSHLFRETLQISFQEYLNGVRFSHALQLLSQTDRRLIDICAACGFSDSRYLNRLFRERFGCTPREYREELRTESPGKPEEGTGNRQEALSPGESLAFLEKSGFSGAAE